jgi:hypothetical protein
MNIFIFPDVFDQLDNGSIAASVDLIEDSGLISSSFNSDTDPYDNFGLISVTSTPATGQITLDSNPPSVLNYRTGNVDTSEDYESLIYGLRDPFSIESYGLIISPVDEFESYELISTPIYSYGTTSKTITYGLDSILYLESPENFGLITENPYIQYGFLTDSVTYTDYGSVSDSLPANQYTDYGNNNLLASDEDYGLVQDPYNEYTDYHFIFYSETIYPYGTFGISGSGAESFTPQTATGSGSISASGIKGEAITDSYNIDSVEIDTSIEFSTSYGLVSASVDETEDYGLVIDSISEVDSYGFLYPLITPFGLFNISGSAADKFKPVFVASGSIIESGILEEKNTDSYNINSVLLGGSPEDYGTVNTSATTNESYGLVIASVDQIENYDYIFYPAGETVYPYGTLRFSGESFNELKIQFTHIGSGSISAEGVGGEAIADFYGIDSSAIDTSIESSINYGLINASADEIEDYGLIISSVTEVDSYGLLYPLLTSFGAFNISGSAGDRFSPSSYIASGSIIESGVIEEKNTDSYNINSVLLGGSPEDYGTVNTSAGTSESYGLVSAPVDAEEDYDYIFYPAGETVYPYGTIRISGESFNELKIQFTQIGSGSISAEGIAGEAITDFYGIDSSAIDTSIESSINYGLINASADEIEDYGLIISSVTEVDSYGLLYPLLTSFGAFNISGSAGDRFSPSSYIASGSIIESGVIEEKNTDSYNINSVLLGGSPEDYGTVNTSAGTSESYELVSASVDQIEDYDYIFYPAGETVYPYGTIQVSGSAITELKIQFTQIGSGSISASGVGGEAITKFYSIDSTEVDTYIEFATSYGLISDPVDETEDYGLIINEVSEIDQYGFLYPVITPFGLFNISGSAGQKFTPSFIGSGSVQESGVLKEENTDSYNIDSVLLGSASEDYGTVNTSATTNESYGLLGAPVDAEEDYDYIFYPAGETVYPYGTIQVSGSVRDKSKSSFVGSGTINITGYVLIPQRYAGSGSFSGFGGAAEVSGSNPPDRNVLFTFSGNATEKNTESHLGSGTAVFSGTTFEKSIHTYIGFGSATVSGSAAESFTPQNYTGSGSFSAFGGAAEVSGSNPPDRNVLFTFSGGYSDLKSTNSNVGSGTIDISGDGATEVRGKPEWRGSGEFEISGSAAESFTPQNYTGSGSFSSFGGGAEVKGSNPPDQTVPIVISGGYSDLKSTYSNVGSGTILIGGEITPDIQIYVPSFTGSGTAVFSGSAAESFTPQNYTGSGSFSGFGGAAEVSGSNPPDQNLLFTFSGNATEKNTESHLGSGTAEFSGTTFEKSIHTYIGSGTGVFSGTVGERFVPQNYTGSGSFSSFGGASEVSGSNPPDQTALFAFSGDAIQKRRVSEVGSGRFSAFGGGAEVKGSNPPDQIVPIVISGTKVEKRRFAEVGSGSFSGFGGAAEVEGSNPPDQTLIITISGNAKERFTPATAVGSGTIFESGNGIEKNTESDVGIGTVAITGGITPNVQIYVPSFTGSGSFSGFGGAAEVSGSNPPDTFVLFTFSGTAGEAFVPQTAVGSGTINISGVGVGVSNPYRAPFVYVTII